MIKSQAHCFFETHYISRLVISSEYGNLFQTLYDEIPKRCVLLLFLSALCGEKISLI